MYMIQLTFQKLENVNVFHLGLIIRGYICRICQAHLIVDNTLKGTISDCGDLGVSLNLGTLPKFYDGLP